MHLQLWSGGVMLIQLAATKKMVMHHGFDKQEKYDREEHYEQDLRCPEQP
jgi:hypothetical protein